MRLAYSVNVVKCVVAAMGIVCCTFVSRGLAAPPVELSFPVRADRREPLARELWAQVVTPSQKIIRLPAYYAGDGRFAVRARADEVGVYRLGKVTEQTGAAEVEVLVKNARSIEARVAEVSRRSPIRIAGLPPGRFEFADGEPYVPLGMNLAWAPRDGVAWYRKAFREFSLQRLNWARVWMAHWGGLNLDWLPEDERAPRPGTLDAHVARSWDSLVEEAETGGVYLQIVLQHHGQFSSTVNPNWNENPWNAANPGGFLRSPSDFFTSERALRLTRQKYRYIVARWGYSPAILAWELFNEVHWVDAIRIAHNEAAVAKWHDTMAAFIRSVDVYGHLVTTSTEELQSAIYRSMDYLQPHLYATAMLAAVRSFDRPPHALPCPIFYGEFGNDHMRVTDEQKAAAVEYLPIVWASLMGEGRYPAQIWEGSTIIDRGRLGEVGAVGRFLAATRLGARENLTAFSAEVETASSVPLQIEGAENWRKRVSPDVTVAMDGRELTAYGAIPRMLVGAPASILEGYPGHITLHVDYPIAATATLKIADAGPKGAVVQVRLDGRAVASHAWPALRLRAGDAAVARPAALTFAVPSGTHAVRIENAGGADWIDFASCDLGLATSSLAAVGRRTTDFIALWLWQRTGVFAVEPPPATSGVIRVENVAAGTWKAVWWDTHAGVAAPPIEIKHPGGTLFVASPPIRRHAALVLTR